MFTQTFYFDDYNIDSKSLCKPLESNFWCNCAKNVVTLEFLACLPGISEEIIQWPGWFQEPLDLVLRAETLHAH